MLFGPMPYHWGVFKCGIFTFYKFEGNMSKCDCKDAARVIGVDRTSVVQLYSKSKGSASGKHYYRTKILKKILLPHLSALQK